jgi:hypothetical protein
VPITGTVQKLTLIVEGARMMLLGHDRWVARLRRRFDYRGELVHEIVVPRSGAGHPGLRVLAPSMSYYPPTLNERNGRRADFRVMVTGNNSSFGLEWLGRVADVGTRLESAMKSLERTDSSAKLVDDVIAGEPAIRFRRPLQSGGALLDWRFEREGWLGAASAITTKRDDELEVVSVSREILATWEWTD